MSIHTVHFRLDFRFCQFSLSFSNYKPMYWAIKGLILSLYFGNFYNLPIFSNHTSSVLFSVYVHVLKSSQSTKHTKFISKFLSFLSILLFRIVDCLSNQQINEILNILMDGCLDIAFNLCIFRLQVSYVCGWVNKYYTNLGCFVCSDLSLYPFTMRSYMYEYVCVCCNILFIYVIRYDMPYVPFTLTFEMYTKILRQLWNPENKQQKKFFSIFVRFVESDYKINRKTLEKKSHSWQR